MCKNDQEITAKPVDNKRLKVVDWRSIIRIDLDIHELAPDFHKHGDLTFVHSVPNSGRASRGDCRSWVAFCSLSSLWTSAQDEATKSRVKEDVVYATANMQGWIVLRQYS